MTLTLAWVRTVGDYEELIFASDSRLRFGCAWDSCQKVFPLPRGDCAIAFAGSTMYAYPFIHAAINAVSLHRGSSTRRIDLYEVKSVLQNAINGMLSEIRDFAHGKKDFGEPDVRLVFGGYSWRKKRFSLWRYHFNPGRREFQVTAIGNWRGFGKRRVLVVLGDPNRSAAARKRSVRAGEPLIDEKDDVEAMAKKAFVGLLRSRGTEHSSGLDLEPLEILRNLLQSKASPHVGGPPQIVKIYPHLNAQPFGIHWPGRKSRIAVLGRLLPRAEKAHVPVIDPVSFKVERGKMPPSTEVGD